MVRPDQPVELRIVLAEGEGVRLPLHQLHRLRLGTEREVRARLVIASELGDLRILLAGREALVGPDIIDLPMEEVSPVEHDLRLGRELGIGDLDCSFLERHARRVNENLSRQPVVPLLFQLRDRCAGFRPQRLVENGVPEVEAIEESVGTCVVVPELPVEAPRQVVLLVDGRPLCERRCRCAHGDTGRNERGHCGARGDERADTSGHLGLRYGEANLYVYAWHPSVPA